MVHYRDSAIGGGSLRVGETIANHLDSRRIAAEMVFAYGSAGPVTQHAKVPCHFLDSQGPRDLRAWNRARALFGKLRPDIVHFQDGVVWLRTALVRTPYKKIAHVHARYEARSRSASSGSRNHPFEASRLFRAFLRSTEAQICISNGARDALLGLDWIKAEKSYVVYNSIDVDRFRILPDKARARAELGLPEDVLLLGMICRLVWEKGCADLFSVIDRLPDRWHGLICGDGPQRDDLRRECEQRGLTDRIHFIDPQDDVMPVYAALDAYAFLSHYEPFGLVLAEAMAAGKPVFGIQSDGEFTESQYPLIKSDIAELIPFSREMNYDAAVPRQVLDRLAIKLSYYGACPERYAGMVRRARGWVDACFDARIQAEAMTRVYENICAHANSSDARLAESYDDRRKAGDELLATMADRRTAAATA